MSLELMMVVSVFVAVALGTGAGMSALVERSSLQRRRLRQIARPSTVVAGRGSLALTDPPHPLAERICRILPRSARRMGEIREQLVAAGYRGHAAPGLFAASQIVAAIAGGLLMLAITRQTSLALLSLAAGFFLPGLWLSYTMSRRVREVRNGLPDVLDLLIVCLESGSGLDQAILRSGQELRLAYPALADELALVANEIRAGTPRSDAFSRFAHRVHDDDVRSFTAMLNQTDRFGTSLAPALRVHADLLRTRRRQRAEEHAAKANVKLVIPLVLCLFPAFYILTLGPAMLQFARVFFNVLGDP